MKYKLVIIFNILLVVAGFCQVPKWKDTNNQSVFPLNKGTYWIYRGVTKWVKESKPENIIAKRTLTWKMEVIDTITQGNITIATIKGFPFDLAWYDEGKNRGDYLLIAVNTTEYYLLSDKAKEVALDRLKNNDVLEKDILNEENEILDLPLTIGKRFAGDLTRQDNWYCWYIENILQIALNNIKGIVSPGKVNHYQLVYRTMPDHQIIEFVPNVGITRYIYVHHGTVSETNLKLVEFHLGKE
jgi:hypothetical protein